MIIYRCQQQILLQSHHTMLLMESQQKGEKFMNNIKVRNAVKEKRLFYYEVAEMLGISEFTLSRKLRKELPQEEQEKIISVIDDFVKGGIKNAKNVAN